MMREPTWAEHRRYWGEFARYTGIMLLCVVVLVLILDGATR